MKVQGLCSWGLGRQCAVVLTVAGFLLGGVSGTNAQEGQGKYVTQAAERLVKLINSANSEGYKLNDNAFTIGGGWLKQSETTWVALLNVDLKANKQYRFLAAGDGDAKDVDLEVQLDGKTVAADTKTDPTAIVNYTPGADGKYVVRLRLYASDNNDPCACLGIVMAK